MDPKDKDDISSNEEEKGSGRFGYTPAPSPSETGPITASPDPSTNDLFGIVLSLSAVQPIWQFGSLFCYRGVWQDERGRASFSGTVPPLGAEVIITIATGKVSLYIF